MSASAWVIDLVWKLNKTHDLNLNMCLQVIAVDWPPIMARQTIGRICARLVAWWEVWLSNCLRGGLNNFASCVKMGGGVWERVDGAKWLLVRQTWSELWSLNKSGKVALERNNSRVGWCADKRRRFGLVSTQARNLWSGMSEQGYIGGRLRNWELLAEKTMQVLLGCRFNIKRRFFVSMFVCWTKQRRCYENIDSLEDKITLIKTI